MTRAIHVGLMVPINNTTFEREALGWLTPGSKQTVFKIPRGKGLLTPETIVPSGISTSWTSLLII